MSARNKVVKYQMEVKRQELDLLTNGDLKIQIPNPSKGNIKVILENDELVFHFHPADANRISVLLHRLSENGVVKTVRTNDPLIVPVEQLSKILCELRKRIKKAIQDYKNSSEYEELVLNYLRENVFSMIRRYCSNHNGSRFMREPEVLDLIGKEVNRLYRA